MNRRPHLDLILVAILAVLCTVAGLALELDPIVRRGAAVLFTTFLPGYAITAALFPRPTIGALERLTLTISLSLAGATLGAVILNATPRGIHSDSWALLLGGITLAATAIALRRRPPFEDVWGGVRPLNMREARGPVLLLALAAVVTAGALAIAGQGAIVQSQPAFTQLWLLPGETEDVLTVGVRNAEPEPLVVRVVVEVGDRVLGEWDRVELEASQTFEEQVDVSEVLSSRDPVVATLFLENVPAEPFRQVRLFLQDR
jgi:hypothetical protein